MRLELIRTFSTNKVKSKDVKCMRLELIRTFGRGLF